MAWHDALPLVVTIAVPFAALYGLSRLARWLAWRRDPIEALITPPRWCKDGDRWMDAVDPRKVERAGERRWQETLRAQRKARKRPRTLPKNVIEMRRRA